MKEIASRWFDLARSQLKPGEEIYIFCESKKEQKALLRAFASVASDFGRLSPAEASKIVVAPSFKDGKIWVKLRKRTSSLFVGFHRKPNGSVQRIDLGEAEERERQIKDLIRRGASKEAIEEALGGLSPQERRKYFGELCSQEEEKDED